MNIQFSATAKEPVPVTIDVADVVEEADPETGKEATYGPPVMKDFMLPRFKRKHWKAWRQAIDAERIAEIQTVGVTPEQTARLLLLYPLAPLTHRELQERAATVEGTGFIVRTCCESAGVPEHAIARMVDDGEADEIALEQIAYMLCGIADPAEVARRLHAQAAAQSTAQGGTQNPDSVAEPTMETVGQGGGEDGGSDETDPFTHSSAASKNSSGIGRSKKK